MFSKEDDYNYIAYHILIILDFFECKSNEKKWVDYKKIIYLYQFISNESLFELMQRAVNQDFKIDNVDYEILKDSYTNSFLKKQLVLLVIINLERNGLISIEKNVTRLTLDIYINDYEKLHSLISNPLFEEERENLKEIKKIFPQLRTMTLKTFLEKIYKRNGVQLWEV